MKGHTNQISNEIGIETVDALIKKLGETHSNEGDNRTLILRPEINPVFTYLAKSNKIENLYGISESSDIYNSPNNIHTRYIWGNPENTHFPDSFFSITFCDGSTLSHSMIDECKRLLRPDGRLCVLSEDFKSTCIDVISSKQNKRGILELEDQFSIGEANISVKVYRIKKEALKKVNPQVIFLKSYSEGKGGISKHCEILKYRFWNDYGIKCTDLSTQSVTDSIVLIEHHPRLLNDEVFLNDIKQLVAANNLVYIELHSLLRCSKETKKYIEENTVLLYRSNENAKEDGVTHYNLFPVIAYSNINVNKPSNTSTLLGTFGYPFKHKGLDEIIDFSIREKLPLEAYLSVNNETKENATVTANELARINANKKDNVRIFTDYLEDNELANRLSRCTHILFGNKGGFDASGTMQFAKRLHRPIIAIDSLQSRMAQTYRVKYFSSKTLAIKREAILLVNRIMAYRTFKGGYLTLSFILNDFFSSLFFILKNKGLTASDLNYCQEINREEDGMKYLILYIRNKLQSQ